MLGMSFKLEKIGPFGKNPSLVNICFMHFFKNCPTLTMHISLNFNLMRVFLDFLESLGRPIKTLLVSSQLDFPCSCKEL